MDYTDERGYFATMTTLKTVNPRDLCLNDYIRIHKSLIRNPIRQNLFRIPRIINLL